MIRSTLSKLVLAGAAVLAMGGCALLSTPDPVQTYRFGGPAAASAAAEGQADLRQISLRRVQFPEAVEGDKILGVTGTETAYIAGARWVSPAADLYMESLENAFSAQATRVRIIGPRELSRGERSLNVDVRAFESRYDAPGAVAGPAGPDSGGGADLYRAAAGRGQPGLGHRRGVRHRHAGPEHPDRRLDRRQRRLIRAARGGSRAGP